MSVTLVLTIMLVASIVRGILGLATLGSLSDSVIRRAIEAKHAGQIMGIGALTILCSTAIILGWVYIGTQLHQPLIVAIVGVNLAVSAAGALIRRAARQDAPKVATHAHV